MKEKAEVKVDKGMDTDRTKTTLDFKVTRSAFSRKHSDVIAFFYNSEASEIDNMVKTAKKLASEQTAIITKR